MTSTGASAAGLRILGAPQRYIQGPDALQSIGAICAKLADRALLVIDPVVRPHLEPTLRRALDGAGVAVAAETFGGECTRAEIARLSDLARAQGSRVVIAVGGGKTIDAAKGVKRSCGLPMICCPTAASNDAPTSRLIVIYAPDHRIEGVELLDVNPEVVVVDTAVIAKAPLRLFLAGIGDALSKKFEVEQCVTTSARNFFGGLPTFTAAVLADTCYQVIRRHGPEALESLRTGTTGEPFERIVEATVLLSGLGFESGGLAAAHALTRGFAALPEAAGALHGEVVAFGLLVQLHLEGRPDAFLDDLTTFYRQMGLPRRLSDLGLETPRRDQLAAIAERALSDAPYLANMVRPVDRESLIAALAAADRRGGGAAL